MREKIHKAIEYRFAEDEISHICLQPQPLGGALAPKKRRRESTILTSTAYRTSAHADDDDDERYDHTTDDLTPQPSALADRTDVLDSPRTSGTDVVESPLRPVVTLQRWPLAVGTGSALMHPNMREARTEVQRALDNWLQSAENTLAEQSRLATASESHMIEVAHHPGFVPVLVASPNALRLVMQRVLCHTNALPTITGMIANPATFASIVQHADAAQLTAMLDSMRQTSTGRDVIRMLFNHLISGGMSSGSVSI